MLPGYPEPCFFKFLTPAFPPGALLVSQSLPVNFSPFSGVIPLFTLLGVLPVLCPSVAGPALPKRLLALAPVSGLPFPELTIDFVYYLFVFWTSLSFLV